MPRAPVVLTALFALVGTATPAGLSAQIFRITPHVGAWLPVGVVQEDLNNGQLVRRAQVGDILVGGRFGVVLARGFAVEGTIAGSPGQVARTDGSGTFDIPALAMLASARVTRSGRLNEDFHGHFGAGFGVIRRSGRGWAGSHVTPAVIAVLGLQTEVVPGKAFAIEMEIHGSRGRRAMVVPDVERAAWRGDLVLSFGVVLPSTRL